NADTACNFGDRAAIIDDRTYRVGFVLGSEVPTSRPHNPLPLSRENSPLISECPPERERSSPAMALSQSPRSLCTAGGLYLCVTWWLSALVRRDRRTRRSSG